MSGTHASLRIEIVDPVVEPVEGAWFDECSAAAPTDGFDEWLRSLTDAAGAARRHVDPATRLVSRSVACVRRGVHRLQARSVQLRHDGNPRRGSNVRQHVFAPFALVADRLAAVPTVIEAAPGTRLHVSNEFTTLPGGGRQADARMILRGSWPRLPVTVRVEAWWREQSVVTVELRSRRRLRYPRRYFRAAHASARAVGDLLSD